MSEFHDDLEYLLDKMETQYCTYPFIKIYDFIYSYYYEKKSN
jgi:hypothetical protein